MHFIEIKKPDRLFGSIIPLKEGELQLTLLFPGVVFD